MTSWFLAQRTLVLVTMLAVLLLTAGCSVQPSAMPAQTPPSGTPLPVTTAEKPAPVTVERVGNTKLIVHFEGGQEFENLMEIEITVTDSRGTSKTQSLGTRQATTPVQRYATSTFVGSFTDNTHVFAVGYYPNGSMKTLLDAGI